MIFTLFGIDINAVLAGINSVEDTPTNPYSPNAVGYSTPYYLTPLSFNHLLKFLNFS